MCRLLPLLLDGGCRWLHESVAQYERARIIHISHTKSLLAFMLVND